MIPRTVSFLVLIALCLPIQTHAQDRGRRGEMEQTLLSRYRLTVLGAGFMHGNLDAIKRAGGVVTLRRAGLCGALDRANICSNAIRGDQVQHVAGSNDVEFMPGEELYINSISVGSDVVSIGLLSVHAMNRGTQSRRSWAAANFFFAPEVLDRGDIGTVYAALDRWLTPQDSAMPTASAAIRTSPAAPSPIQLTPGMSRDEVVAALGVPVREIKFGDSTWLTYPGMVALLKEGRLASVDATGQLPGKINVTSDPPNSDVYVDGSFIGSTPANLQLPPGTYRISVQSHGYQSWQRELRVFAGVESSLRAQLEPSTAVNR